MYVKHLSRALYIENVWKHMSREIYRKCMKNIFVWNPSVVNWGKKLKLNGIHITPVFRSW